MGVDNGHSAPLASSSLENTSFCHLQIHSLTVETTGLCSHRNLQLCKGPSVLGREGLATGPWWASLFGGECIGALAGDGAAGLLYRWRGSQGCPTLQLSGDQFAPTGRTSPAPMGRIISLRCETAAIAEAAGPTQGVPVGGQWWEMTSTTNHYHHLDGLKNHSDPGGDATTGEVWKPAPDPLAGVCGDCMIPVGGWPTVSHHQDPSWRGQPTQPIWNHGIDVKSDLTDPTPCHRGDAPRHDKLYSQHSGSGA